MQRSVEGVFGENIPNLMDRWVGSVAVVTGASSGIGASIAERFVKLGLTVVALARRTERMEELAAKLAEEKGALRPMFCDLRDENNIKEVFDWIEENLGGVSILINNAGVMFPTTLMDADISALKTELDVNVLSLCITTKYAIESMKKHGNDGHIIHISSITGHYIPELAVPCMNLYPATKFAVRAMTELLRRELRTQIQPRIKISCVSPGLVTTEIIDSFTNEGGIRDGMKQAPALTSDDITDSVIFILGSPPHVQIHDIIVRICGEAF